MPRPHVPRLLVPGRSRATVADHGDRIYLVHLAWAFFLLLAIVHFWWFEFGLQGIGVWTFEIYLFVICYAALFFFLGALLFPDRIDEYSDFAEYFHSRQKWFYGLLAAMFLADLVDTAIRGAGHFSALGAGYPIRQGALAALALIMMFVTDRRYHGAFATVAIAAEVYWIASQFEVLEIS